MADKTFLATVVADVLFLASGIIQLAFSLVVRSQMHDVPTNGRQALRNLLYQRFPLTAGIVNATLILIAFVITLPGLYMPTRGFLKTAGYGITVCGIFTMCLGLFLWVMTLRVKADFEGTYVSMEPQVQEIVQSTFGCCGYINSTSPAFITDATCPSPAAAALLRGCAGFVSSFANTHIDNIFTAMFGMVGIDALFILAIACLLKERKARERYRHIDEKSGFRQF